MNRRPSGRRLLLPNAVLRLLESPEGVDGCSRGTGHRRFGDVLADRVLPSWVFGTLAMVVLLRTASAAARPPAPPSLPDWLGYLLGLTHGGLTFLFCALIAALFLVRRTPRGRRAPPVAMVLALTGTFGMSAV